MVVAFVSLSIILPFLKIKLRVPAQAQRLVWLTGVFALGLPFSFLFWGETLVTPGLAGMINGTVALWVFLYGIIFMPKQERLTQKKVIGLLAGLSGVIFIFIPSLMAQKGSSSVLGIAAIFGMANAYAIGVLLNRKIFTDFPQIHPFSNLYQQSISGLVFLLLVTSVIEGFPTQAPEHYWRLLIFPELYLGFVSTTLGFMIFYSLIKKLGSVRTATVTYVVPATTLVFDFLINSRIPGVFEVIGVVGITAGVVILNWPTPQVSSTLKG